jgi:hypothetical protein
MELSEYSRTIRKLTFKDMLINCACLTSKVMSLFYRSIYNYFYVENLKL